MSVIVCAAVLGAFTRPKLVEAVWLIAAIGARRLIAVRIVAADLVAARSVVAADCSVAAHRLCGTGSRCGHPALLVLRARVGARHAASAVGRHPDRELL